MNSQIKKEERQKQLLIIKNSYTDELSNIVCLANKLGWKASELEENPELLLHIFYEYLDIIK